MFLPKLLHPLFSFIFPSICLMCSAPNKNSRLCLSCLSMLPTLPPHCQRCGSLLFGTEALLCGKCQRHPIDSDNIFVLAPYAFPIKQLITRLKFDHQLSYAAALSELLIDKIRVDWYKNAPLPQLIIPVPLHVKRLQERGFNQALEIAKPLSRQLSIPLDCHGMTREKATQAQSGLSASARQKNLNRAFVCQKHYQGLHLAILDDVITTGQTLNACCRLLRAQGAKQIDIWCCARTIKAASDAR